MHSFSFWEKIRREFANYKDLEKLLLEYWFYTEILMQNLGTKGQPFATYARKNRDNKQHTV